MWYQSEQDEEDDLMFSPAFMARRASESWIETPPAEVTIVNDYLNFNRLLI